MFHVLTALYEQLRAYLLIIFYLLCRQLPHWLSLTQEEPPTSVLLLTIPGAGGFNAQFGRIVTQLKRAHPFLKIQPYKPQKGLTCEKEALVLAHIIEKEQKNFGHIILLGHSRGGLLANEAVKNLAQGDNITLITLATPWHGAIMAERVITLKRFWFGNKIVNFISWILGTPIESCSYRYEPFTDEKDKIYPIAARYDLIVGSTTRQSPSEDLLALIPTTHLGIPFHYKTVTIVLDIIQYITQKKSETDIKKI